MAFLDRHSESGQGIRAFRIAFGRSPSRWTARASVAWVASLYLSRLSRLKIADVQPPPALA